MLLTLSLISFVCAALPAAMYFANVRIFRPPAEPTDGVMPSISVLIPARNEEQSIEACVRSVLANERVNLEVIVLDDQSTDRTAEIVRSIAATDSRLRLESAPPLPAGWSGKQHACFVLSKLAQYDVLTFLDADVRLAPNALSKLAGFQRSSNAELVSGFPYQETGTIFEKLLIPLIHWLLLGFLPLSRMRKDLRPGLGAGCGQWFLTTRQAYEAVGGHAAIKESFHDGIELPRAYRQAGLMTDLCDVTDLATCRMYRTAGQVWNGLAKNAREGLGNLRLLPFFTVLFLMGQVLPLLWALILIFHDNKTLYTFNVLTLLLCGFTRVHGAKRFHQSALSANLHPIGILLLLAIQWYANLRALIGRPIGWKGRIQPS